MRGKVRGKVRGGWVRVLQKQAAYNEVVVVAVCVCVCGCGDRG